MKNSSGKFFTLTLDSYVHYVEMTNPHKRSGQNEMGKYIVMTMNGMHIFFVLM